MQKKPVRRQPVPSVSIAGDDMMTAILIGVLAISRRLDKPGKSIGQVEKVLDVEKRGACDILGVIGF